MGELKITRKQRIAGIVLIGLVFIAIQSVGTWRAAAASPALRPTLFWILYASYELISLLFYCVGSLVWLYAYSRQQIVATLLFGFTSLMMVAFGTLSPGSVGDSFFLTLGNVSSACSVLFLFLLVVRFPYNLFTVFPHRLLRAVILSVIGLCSITSIRGIYVYQLHFSAPKWLDLLCLIYYILTCLAIVAIGAFSARHATTMREQQQMRLFFLGMLVSLGPILSLTIIPTLLHWSLVIDGSISMIFLVLFPLTLSYTILRYDLLIFDSYVRKVAITIVSSLGLVLLAYVLFALGNILVGHMVSISLAVLLLAGVLGAPLVCWLGRHFTEQLFFPEARYYTTTLNQPSQQQGGQTFDMLQIAQRLIIDIMATLHAPGACLFVFNEATHTYDLLEPLPGEERTASMQTYLLKQVHSYLSLPQENSSQIAENSPFLRNVSTTQRPLFLREALAQNSERAGGFARYIARRGEVDHLLAPLYSPMGQTIGIVLVSARGDDQPYAGPELEVLTQLLQRSSMAIETARQFQIATRQQAHIAHELEEAYHQQRHLAEMKEQLIIHMSHELRTPLTEVSGYLELLSQYRETLDPTAQELFLQKATHGCDELLQLLSTILDAAKPTEASTPPHLEKVLLAPLLQEEIEHLDPMLTGQYHIELHTSESQQVWANEQFVHQIVRNLLSNALKYSSAQTTIMINTRDDGPNVCLQIKDEGDGIPQDEMPLLFGKFVRLARHHAGSIRGTGLGLYLSKQMVEAMGGHIWAESSGKEGEGATFFVQLPRTISHCAPIDMTVSTGFSIPVEPTEKMA